MFNPGLMDRPYFPRRKVVAQMVLSEADKKQIIRELEVIQTKIWINKTMSRVCGFVFAVSMLVIGWFSGHDWYRDKQEKELIRLGHGTYDLEGKFRWKDQSVPPAVKP